MGEALRKQEMLTRFWLERLNVGEKFEDLGIEGSLMLK
jgi:hypothetical protein